MTMTYSVAAKNARAQALASAIDAGASSGSLAIYTGSAPANVGAITDQALLVTLILPEPCSVGVASGILTLASIPEQMVQATGQAAWARLLDGDGNPLADMTVGVTGSGADIELPTVDLIQGSYVRITAGQIVEA